MGTKYTLLPRFLGGNSISRSARYNKDNGTHDQQDFNDCPYETEAAVVHILGLRLLELRPMSSLWRKRLGVERLRPSPVSNIQKTYPQVSLQTRSNRGV